MKEENQAVIKALNMYGRVPEMWELLEEIERLNNKIEKALLHIDILQELIYKQPSNNAEDDTWILERLNGIKQCLKGSDRDE